MYPQVTAAEFRKIRTDAGHTQKQAAQYADVSVRQVQRWEAGTQRIAYAYYFLYKSFTERV